MAYIIEQRYLFYSTNNEIFTGDVVDVSHETIWLTNVSSAKFHRGTSIHSMPLEYIVSAFQLSELEKGKQYKFWKHDDTTFISVFDSISSNICGETLHVTHGVFRLSMPLLFIKKIEST
jgi:hypothetical protein